MNIYLKIPGGPLGSSKNIRHLNEIVLTHYSRPRTLPGVTGAADFAKNDRGNMGEIEIGVDTTLEKRTEAFLAQHCLSGRIIPSAVITSETPVGNGAVTRTLIVNMSFVRVLRFHMERQVLIANLFPEKTSWIYQ